MLAVFMSINFTACGRNENICDTSDSEVLQPVSPKQDESFVDAVESYSVEEDIPNETKPPPPEYVEDETVDAQDYVADFNRIDFDAIDFTSMIIPTDTQHGYIGHWYVRHISEYLPSRVAFTYRELDTALWLKQMLIAYGFCENYVRLQTFSHCDVAEWEDYFGWGLQGLQAIREDGWTNGHEIRNYSQNLIVTIPGRSEQTIIIGAHYDSLRYPGTSDNASGMALLMENARRMLLQDNYHTLVYVFFGAHEIGLLGGFYFYNSLTPEERESIRIFIQADILIEGPDLVFSTGHDLELSSNALTEQITLFAESFYESHEVRISPMGLVGSEQRLFLYKGHTTLALWGIDPHQFTNFLHSYKDCYDYINAVFPGMIEKAMSSFALFLEAILLEI
jgi:hypothetical protein